MRDSATYLKFAEECLALARSAAPEHRAVLTEMAQAWRRLAQEAEQQNGSAREQPEC
jgi:hypothetical protein